VVRVHLQRRTTPQVGRQSRIRTIKAALEARLAPKGGVMADAMDEIDKQVDELCSSVGASLEAKYDRGRRHQLRRFANELDLKRGSYLACIANAND